MELLGSVLVALITALVGPIVIIWVKKKLTKSKDEIAVEIFGKRVVLKRIQIADYLTTPFQFEGPMSIQNQLSFTMPDGSLKKINAKPSKCIIKVLPDKIEVSTQIEFK